MSEEASKSISEETPKTYSTWLGFAIREIRPGRTVRIRILWGRVAALLVILGCLAWFAKSWGLYLFFRNVRDFEEVSFMDMVWFPMNRDNVRVQQGNYQIEQGKQALEREDYRRAFTLLREGVARSKANLEGRMLLAQIYAGWRPDLANDLLVDGIEYGIKDTDYMRLMGGLLLRQKEDQRVLELTEGLLDEELTEEARQILLVTRLQAAMNHGRYGIVRNIFENSEMNRTMDGLLIGTRIYARTGRSQDAVNVLKAALESIPEEQANPVYEQLISIYKAEGEFGKARESALEMMLANALAWRPRILLVDVLSASGMNERRDGEIQSILKEFRNDEQAMAALAQLSADYGNVSAASRLYEVALENGYSLSLFSLTLAEAMVQDGQYERAIELCNELSREDPAWMLTAEAAFYAIRSLAYFGSADEELGNLYLKNFLESERTNDAQLYQAARRFQDLGFQRQALKLLQEAYARDSQNERVLAAMIEAEMDLGIFFSLDRHIRELFGLRRTEYAIIEGILSRLRSDRFLFTKDRGELLDGLEAILEERQLMQDWNIWSPAT